MRHAVIRCLYDSLDWIGNAHISLDGSCRRPILPQLGGVCDVLLLLLTAPEEQRHGETAAAAPNSLTFHWQGQTVGARRATRSERLKPQKFCQQGVNSGHLAHKPPYLSKVEIS